MCNLQHLLAIINFCSLSILHTLQSNLSKKVQIFIKFSNLVFTKVNLHKVWPNWNKYLEYYLAGAMTVSPIEKVSSVSFYQLLHGSPFILTFVFFHFLSPASIRVEYILMKSNMIHPLHQRNWFLLQLFD